VLIEPAIPVNPLPSPTNEPEKEDAVTLPDTKSEPDTSTGTLTSQLNIKVQKVSLPAVETNRGAYDHRLAAVSTHSRVSC
jgi:hypothetical protein